MDYGIRSGKSLSMGMPKAPPAIFKDAKDPKLGDASEGIPSFVFNPSVNSAGAFRPMIGWAAVTGSVGVESLLLFLIIFMWTPPHFWALALFMKDDYSKAGVPMLTVTHGRDSATRRHILVYAVLLAPFAILLALSSVGGPVVLATAIVLNALFIGGAWRIARRDEAAAEADRYKAEKAFFRFSLAYLFLHFGALLVERSLMAFRMGGW